MTANRVGHNTRLRVLTTFWRKRPSRRAPGAPSKKNTAGGGRRQVVSRIELSETVKARAGSPVAPGHSPADQVVSDDGEADPMLPLLESVHGALGGAIGNAHRLTPFSLAATSFLAE
jgi:hypothetical protein